LDAIGESTVLEMGELHSRAVGWNDGLSLFGNPRATTDITSKEQRK
jgi:hypothetical protein